MKNMKTLIAISFTALLVSCSTTKETTSAKANTDRGRSNVETTSNTGNRTTESSRISRTNASTMATEKRITDVEEKMNFQRMYEDLEMTDEQVAHFEKEWNAAKHSWRKINRDKVMNNFERTEYQDRILRNVLEDTQFETYQQWVRENADRN